MADSDGAGAARALDRPVAVTAPVIRDRDLFRMVAIAGYTAYTNTLSGTMSPRQRAAFDRMTHPQVGDLVLEITTLWSWLDKPDGMPGAALGYLRCERDEPCIDQVALDAMHADGEFFIRLSETIAEIPHEKVQYVLPLDGAKEARWVNASFIQIPTTRPPW